MRVGVISSWDPDIESGLVISSGEKLAIHYKNGRAFISSATDFEPRFTQTHEQRHGFELKQPRVGDPIVFVPNNQGEVNRWGYAERYVDALTRKFGREFRTL